MPGSSKEYAPRTVDKALGRALQAYRANRGGVSQDALASYLRHTGLSWSRSTLAALEAGTKPVTLDEFVHLCWALGQSAQQWFAGQGAITTKGGATVNSDTIRAIFSGATLELWHGSPDLSDYLAHALLAVSRTMRFEDAVGERRAQAVEAAKGEAERRAVRPLKAVSALEVSLAAFSRWGRSLTQERDARVSAQAAENVSPRTLQAIRGHVTRALLSELAPLISGADRAFEQLRAIGRDIDKPIDLYPTELYEASGPQEDEEHGTHPKARR